MQASYVLFALPRENAIEFVQQIVGGLADDFTIELSDQLVIIRHLGCLL
jgi:hypothetical protein